MAHYSRAKFMNCYPTNLSVSDGFSHTNASMQPNSILYWPPVPLEWIHDAPNHEYPQENNEHHLDFRATLTRFSRFRLVFCPPFWWLLTCLHVKLVDPCLGTSYDASHKCGIRIVATWHVSGDLLTVLHRWTDSTSYFKQTSWQVRAHCWHSN